MVLFSTLSLVRVPNCICTQHRKNKQIVNIKLHSKYNNINVLWRHLGIFHQFCFVFRSVFLVIEGGTLGLPGTVQQILISFSYYFFKSSDCFYIQKIKFEQYDNRDTRMPTRFLSTRFLMDTSVRFSSKEQF